jgi:thiamine biosynthesis protein ThiS
MGIEKIEVKEDKTIKEFIDELNLSSVPILLELNGEIFYPDENYDRKIQAGDRLAVIPIIAGG